VKAQAARPACTSGPARLTLLNGMAVAAEHLGGLDRIQGVVKLSMMMSSSCLASDVKWFGQRKRVLGTDPAGARIASG